LNLVQGASMALSVTDDPDNDRVTVTVALGSVPSHTHTQADVASLVTDLAGKAAKAGDTFSGAVAIATGGNGDGPFTVSGDHSSLADHTLLKVLNNGELIVAGGTGNGYRCAEIMAPAIPLAGRA
jgi:hypothetical protein